LIEFICLTPALIGNLIELASEWIGKSAIAQPQPDDGCASGSHLDLIVRSGLGPRPVQVDGLPPTRQNVVVYCVLDVRCSIRLPEYPLIVGVVLGEKQWRVAVAVKPIIA
jgi:hypothetical protein